MEFLIQIAFLVAIYFIGTHWIEKKHYKSINERELQFLNTPVLNIEHVDQKGIEETFLVTGSVVISTDAFKQFVAGLIKIFGGRLITFESLLDRGRREAILRMHQEAKEKGAQAIINLRIETASISKGGKNNLGTVEVLAYGTAIKGTF